MKPEKYPSNVSLSSNAKYEWNFCTMIGSNCRFASKMLCPISRDVLGSPKGEYTSETFAAPACAFALLVSVDLRLPLSQDGTLQSPREPDWPEVEGGYVCPELVLELLMTESLVTGSDLSVCGGGDIVTGTNDDEPLVDTCVKPSASAVSSGGVLSLAMGDVSCELRRGRKSDVNLKCEEAEDGDLWSEDVEGEGDVGWVLSPDIEPSIEAAVVTGDRAVVSRTAPVVVESGEAR